MSAGLIEAGIRIGEDALENFGEAGAKAATKDLLRGFGENTGRLAVDADTTLADGLGDMAAAETRIASKLESMLLRIAWKLQAM